MHFGRDIVGSSSVISRRPRSPNENALNNGDFSICIYSQGMKDHPSGPFH